MTLVTSPASPRPWSHDPSVLAQDYLVINDNRGKGEIVMLVWIAPQMTPDPAAREKLTELLGKYVLVGVADAHIQQATGLPSFDKFGALTAQDAAGHQLQLIDESNLPPTMAGGIVTLQGVFAKTLGPLGQGVNWFVFDAGSVAPCSKGRLSIPLAGETYTWDTPIPGCS